MQIIRKDNEVSEKQQLERAVETAEAKVADWRRSVATIEGQLHAAGDTLTKAKEKREQHAMAARLGDATAKAAIAHARSETHAAEQDVIDLQIALPEAQAQLASAERDAASARHGLAKLLAEGKMRERIAVSGEIDVAIANLARLYADYTRLGSEIVNMPGALPQNGFGMVNHEGAMGVRRVAAALPPFVQKLFPGSLHDEIKKEPLATSEARHWNLAPEKSDVKAA